MRMGIMRFIAPIALLGIHFRYEGDEISVGLQLWVSKTLIAKKDGSRNCRLHNPIVTQILSMYSRSTTRHGRPFNATCNSRVDLL